jgi:Ca-activated chloride channel family protein
MRSRPHAGVLTVFFFICLVLTATAAGVKLGGTVVDSAGTVLPGATLELASGTAVIGKTTSAADGSFAFENVAAGSYEIRVTLSGFRQARIAVIVGTTTVSPLTIKLQVGSTQESVTVQPSEVYRALPSPPLPAPQMTPQAIGSPNGGGRGSGVGTGSGAGVGYGGGAGGYPGGGVRGIAQPFETATYAPIEENKFRSVGERPLSTFSIDVDTASYSNVRRFLNEGRLPPADAVRVEELINYFHFDYPDRTEGAPFGIATEVGPCPWNTRHRLALIGVQAERINPAKTPPRNLVFLLDVSGSMAPPERLPLVKTAMKMLVDTLRAEDRVAIVTYAGTSGVALPSTRGDRHAVIEDAISSLNANGSTNGAAGIQLAYEIAAENFVKGGINRVILATDGDFNVGITSIAELTRMIEEKRSTGVFLSVFGVGTDNLKDATMERLADKGNGNYAYLDSLTEAHRVLVREASSTLVTVAKDVKIQVEFNPATVGAYRLVGYENRRLQSRDFNDDFRDAGELGSGHTVTALYEIVPPGEAIGEPGADPLKYQQTAPAARVPVPSTELMTVKVRYKQPDGERSTLVTVPVGGRDTTSARNLSFAAAVAEFGMLLRESPYKSDATWADAARLARTSRGEDADGYRAEFVRLIDLAGALDRQRAVESDGGKRR